MARSKSRYPIFIFRVEYLVQEFEKAYPVVKRFLSEGRYRNVLFNLDQYGHSHVYYRTLVDIMRSYPSAEVFYTFAIKALVSYLRSRIPRFLAAHLAKIGLDSDDLKDLQSDMSRKSWLGAAERLVFEKFEPVRHTSVRFQLIILAAGGTG